MLLLLLIPTVIYVDFLFTRPVRVRPYGTFRAPAGLLALGMQATGLPDPPWELPYSDLLILDLGKRLGWPGGDMDLWLPLRPPTNENDAAIWDESRWEHRPSPVGVYRGSPLATTPVTVSQAVTPAEVQSPIANWITIGAGLGGLMPWQPNPLAGPLPVVDPADLKIGVPDFHLISPPVWNFLPPRTTWVLDPPPEWHPAPAPAYNPPVLITAGFQFSNLILVWAHLDFTDVPPVILAPLTDAPDAIATDAAPPGSGADTTPPSPATLTPIGSPAVTTNLPEPQMTLVIAAALVFAAYRAKSLRQQRNAD